jgi:hypothetical protein
MRTDELIDLLSTNVEPVDHRRVGRALGIAVAVGAAAALGATLVAFGVRPDLGEPGALAFLLLKLAFAVGVVILASVLLMKLARPGGERTARPAMALAPFAAIMLLAAVSLASAPSSHWDDMILDGMWLECLLSIPIIAIVPFAAIVLVVRQVAAPTDLTRTGALIGVVAGGVSAMGYALHCTGNSLPFVALWYSGTIALCTFAGATLGPRLLRW